MADANQTKIKYNTNTINSTYCKNFPKRKQSNANSFLAIRVYCTLYSPIGQFDILLAWMINEPCFVALVECNDVEVYSKCQKVKIVLLLIFSTIVPLTKSRICVFLKQAQNVWNIMKYHIHYFFYFIALGSGHSLLLYCINDERQEEKN